MFASQFECDCAVYRVLQLAASAFFAAKDAIYAARSDAGITGYFDLPTPATSEYFACFTQLVSLVLWCSPLRKAYYLFVWITACSHGLYLFSCSVDQIQLASGVTATQLTLTGSSAAPAGAVTAPSVNGRRK